MRTFIRGDRVKKVLILTIIVAFCLTGCAEKANYNHLKQVNVNELEEQTIIHEGLTDTLPTLKEWIWNSSLKEKNYLDWASLEKIATVREFKNAELAEDFAEATAFYVMNTDTMVVCPNFFQIESGGQRTYSLTHELMHSLVGVGQSGAEKSMNLFVEGITDHLTYVVLGDTLEYELNYRNEVYCISWLMSFYGFDTIAESICNGEILDFIDEKSETGNGSKLHEDLATIDHSTDMKEVKQAILSEIEILTMLCENSPNADMVQELTEQFQKSYAPCLN